MKISLSSTLAAAAGFAVVAAGAADAAIVGNAFVLSTTNGNGTDGIIIPNGSLVFDPIDNSYSYASSSPIVLSNGVTVESFDVFYLNTDPTIAMTFLANTSGLATSFNISTATVAFAPLTGESAMSGASATLTGNNASNANLLGLFGGSAHHASFNTGVFHSSVGPINVPNANGTLTDDTFIGPAVVAGPVTSMFVDWAFQVDADDSVSLNSFFTITPAPGSIALLGLGGLVMSRRRR